MKNIIFAILVSALAASQAGVIEPPTEVTVPYGFIDAIVKALLESFRSKLANLKFDDVNEVFKDENFNATVNISNILIADADKFEIKILKTNLIPLGIKNLTLTWNEVTANADYDVNATVGVPTMKEQIKIFGKGNAKAVLKNLYFTIAAVVDYKDNALQIKPKGLSGFNLKIEKASVNITSLMGSTDLGNAVGGLISRIIPEAVDTLHKPLFNAFSDDIIKILNEILKKKNNLLMDEQAKALLESSEAALNNLEINEDAVAAIESWFDFGIEKTDEEEEEDSI